MVDVVILVVCVLVSFATGVFVYARNPKQIVNRVYGLLTLSLIMFSITNFFSLRTLDRLFYIRSVIFFTTIAVACLYYLIIYLNKPRPGLSQMQRLGVYFTVLVALLDYTPLVFSGLKGTTNPVPIPSFGIALYVVHLVGFLAVSCSVLLHRVDHTRGVQRLQYIYMLIGILPMFFLAPATGVIMPVILGNTSLVVLSPVYGAFFVCLIGYAIIKHRLFDIKLIIARSLAYAATIAVLSLTYGAFFILVAQYIFHVHFPVAAAVFLSIATGVAALAFQHLKTVFDKLSNRLFYQDAYDTQELFDAFNQVLVSTINLDKLLHGSTEVINEYIKAQFCMVVIRDGTQHGRIIATPANIFGKGEIGIFHRYSSHLRAKVIVTDDLSSDDTALKKMLTKHNVAMLVQLSADDHDGSIGHIILGTKKSGNIYTAQDINVIETLANELIIAIQNAMRFEEIERFSETLQERINDATHKLRASNEKLRRLDETKDDFISMASHQLRTPLTSVKGYVSMVLDGDVGPLTTQQKKLLTQSFVSAQRMVYLISDLLNVSRLRTGKFVIEPIPCNIAQVTNEEVSQLVETAKGRGLELIYHRPEHFPTYMLDEMKLRQVIMNFIDNAIYYTPEGGKITVQVIDKPKSIELMVIDTGIGVPKSEQHHLFTKFYRADNAKIARPDGTGLGLFMAKKVIVAQGGAIIFKSQQGKGSTFGFSFAKDRLTPAQK